MPPNGPICALVDSLSPFAVVTPLPATTTALTSSLNPSTYGQSVTFTATVTSGGGTPTGTVTFKNGAASLGSVKLVNGSASLNTSALNAGVRTITAHYAGTTKYAPSSATLKQTVNKAATTTVVTTSGSPSTHGNPVTFTATVSSSVGTPIGNVIFKDGATPLETVALLGGTAQYTSNTLAVGTHTIHGNYLGDLNHAASAEHVRQVVK